MSNADNIFSPLLPKNKQTPEEKKAQAEKKTEILQQLYGDVMLFALHCLKHHFTLSPAKFHYDIYNLLKQKHKYNCIVAPRGHSKSTTVTLAYALHQILFQEVKFVVIISDTSPQADLFLDAIRNELETNETIRALFGNFKGKTWSDKELETVYGQLIVSKGAGEKIRGLKYRQYRPDLIIADDLENDEMVENPKRREKLRLWWNKSVVPALAKASKLVIVGTILHYDSLLNRIHKNPHYHKLFYRAIMEGRPLWEDKYTLQELKEIKDSFHRDGLLEVFLQEYMNEPISDENAIFKTEYFRYYSHNGFEAQVRDIKNTKNEYGFFISNLSIFTTVDLAISQKENADYTVILTAGVDDKNNIFILEYSRDRYTPIQTIDKLFEHFDKYNSLAVGIEGVAYQKALQWFVEEEMKRRGIFMNLVELKADADKERRIRGMQPRYAIGTVYHTDAMADMEEELLMFPKAPHDDIADALAYIPQIAFPGTPNYKKFSVQKQRTRTSNLVNNELAVAQY